MRTKLFIKYLSGSAASKIAPVVLAMLFSCVVSFGQETEAAASLKLTGTSLPAGAQRVLPPHVPSEIEGALENMVATGGGKVRRGDSEVLLWTGNDLKKTGATAILNRLTGGLKAAGWTFEVGGVENGVTVFSLLKEGAAPRGLVGFYGEADGTLLFALTELLANGGAQTNSNPANSNPSNSNQTSFGDGGNIGDYSFTTPAGWSRSNAAGKIVLSSEIGSKIEFLSLTNSSGNLERDADRILWQFFKGYDSWYANGFEPDYGTFEKGKTVQGLEYYRVYRYAKKIGDENNGMAESKFDAIVMLVKVGDKVAVIAGRQPFQTSEYVKGSALGALDLILYDLQFKSAPAGYNLKNDLLGSWSTASSSVALAYTFNANGTFNKGAAIGFRTRRDRDTDNVTTTSYGMTDRYSLAGNVLTQSYKNTGEVVKYKIRFYQTKYDKDAWQQKIGFLPLDSTTGETIVMRKSD